MFHSFFPNPKLFFLSGVIYAAICVVIWYTLGGTISGALGFAPAPEQPVVGLGFFVTGDFLFFYLFIAVAIGLFAGYWARTAPHPWQMWSVLGTALILFSTYFSVQVSVALNHWRGPFFDLIQESLDPSEREVPVVELYALLLIFFQIAMIWMVVYVATRFFVSHYVFRWRTAMNDYYMSRWKDVRHIEGASQRVQEDTMRFAGITENLGVAIVDSVMTLFAFMPLLLALSSNIEELPFVGAIPAPLVTAAVFWALFGTVLMAVVGIRLPGLEFRNQRVEAAYRKELVYGEDDELRAQPPRVGELFSHVRKNYFRLYFHYMYFNIFRGLYIQADGIYAYFLLLPAIAAKAITFGVMQQIVTAFTQVTNSFQFLVNTWPTIVELLSIYKRLKAFEAAMDGEQLADIEFEPETQPTA